jgi:hypothetical protein
VGNHFPFPFAKHYLKLLNLVLLVVMQADPEFRPSMSEVVQSLLRCVQRTISNRGMAGYLSNSQRSDISDW